MIFLNSKHLVFASAINFKNLFLIMFSLQNSLKFVKQVVLEDETKLKGIPPEECSKIMLWRHRFSIGVVPRNLVKTTSLLDVISQR